MDTFPWDKLFQLTWPGAAVAIAFSPVGRALAARIHGGNGRPPADDRLPAALERLEKVGQKTLDTLHRLELVLTDMSARLKDR